MKYPFALQKSREISSEMQYNVWTLRKEHQSPEEQKIYVHGKLLTILAVMMESEDDVRIDTDTKTDIPVSTKVNLVEELIRADWNNAYSIKELAKIAGTNECYIKRDFKAVYGKPIHAYRQDKKMEYAKTLLVYSEESIKSISKKLGYKYTTHFNAAYKKHYHITPGEARNNAANGLLSGESSIFRQDLNDNSTKTE